jgi:hypothetical protein
MLIGIHRYAQTYAFPITLKNKKICYILRLIIIIDFKNEQILVNRNKSIEKKLNRIILNNK